MRGARAAVGVVMVEIALWGEVAILRYGRVVPPFQPLETSGRTAAHLRPGPGADCRNLLGSQAVLAAQGSFLSQAAAFPVGDAVTALS